MEAALYQPVEGYYNARVRTIGTRGDFSTAGSLSPLLAQAVAAWLEPRLDEGGGNVIEVGPGSGEMAAEILARLPGISYHLVERSPRLRAAQEARLSGQAVRWHEGLAEALDAVDGRALIWSQELVDAFPCAALRRAGDEWQQLVLRLGPDEERVESWEPGLPASMEEIPWSLRAARFPQPWRVEAHPAYRAWLRSWAPHWRAGHLLTIDYGDRAPALTWRRPPGSLRAYFQHMRMEGPELYARVGHQDLTADVNIDDLIAWGEELGWATVELLDQRHFLLRTLPELAQPTDPLARFLLHPDGMGGAMKVLHQQKG